MPFNKTKNDAILSEIKTSKTSGLLVPFVGAGFSRNIEGYPKFEDFININIAERLCTFTKRPITDKLNIWDVFNGNPNEAIEYFIYAVGSTNTVDKQEIFDSGKKVFHEEVKIEFNKVERILIHGKESEWAQHLNLVDKFEIIYTTNWDHAIEKACEFRKIGYVKIYHDSEKILKNTQPGTNGNIRNIVKFHGDFIDCNSLVACESDYFKRIAMSNHALDQDFIRLLHSHNIMFIGYSIADINVKYIINSTSRWREVFSAIFKNQFWISVDNPTLVHDEKIKFLEEWIGIKTYFLFSSDSSKDEKKQAIRQFIGSL